MKSTDILRQEHDMILRALSVLQMSCIQIRDYKKPIQKETWQHLLIFFRLFADKCHHAKEESYLFPKLISLGIPEQGSPISVMLLEHNMGRDLISKLERSSDSPALFLETALQFCSLLQQHIMKENMILFPMADALLNNEAEAELINNFKEINNTLLTDEFLEQTLKPLETIFKSMGAA